MSPRTTSKTVTFALPFLLKGVDRVLPAGDYRVVTDEELMEGLSFPVYRRVSTMILVPTESRQAVEMLTVDPLDLQVAQDRDVAAHQTTEADPLRNAPDK
jgi:hypothetical protein